MNFHLHVSWISYQSTTFFFHKSLHGIPGILYMYFEIITVSALLRVYVFIAGCLVLFFRRLNSTAGIEIDDVIFGVAKLRMATNWSRER